VTREIKSHCAPTRRPGAVEECKEHSSVTALFSRGSAIALLVAGAFFMESLDGTIVVSAATPRRHTNKTR
jgi:hypothetical protein